MQISTKMVFECVCGWVCFAKWYGLSLAVSLCLSACCVHKKQQEKEQEKEKVIIIHYNDIQPKK